jgi:hypothetical protein
MTKTKLESIAASNVTSPAESGTCFTPCAITALTSPRRGSTFQVDEPGMVV